MENIRVIIADTSSRYTGNIADYLGTRGNIETVAICESGIDLMDKINRLSPDVVVMNLILRDCDGFTVLKRMGHITARIPFIICTEMYNEITVRLAQKHGAREYFCKPIIPETLYEFISECCRDDDITLFDDRSGRGSDRYIAERLSQMGISAGCSGYSLIISAVKKIIEQPTLRNSVTKNLYPLLAELYNTNSRNIERNIRSAIHSAYRRGMLCEYGKAPTNKEFLLELSMAASGNVSLI